MDRNRFLETVLVLSVMRGCTKVGRPGSVIRLSSVFIDIGFFDIPEIGQHLGCFHDQKNAKSC